MIPGVEFTDADRDKVVERLVRGRELRAVPGQVECPRPHHSLYWPGSRCHCGAQV